MGRMWYYNIVLSNRKCHSICGREDRSKYQKDIFVGPVRSLRFINKELYG